MSFLFRESCRSVRPTEPYRRGTHQSDTMTTERRCEVRIKDGTLYIEREDDLLEVSLMDAVIELIGGGIYTIGYIDRQCSVSWPATDRNNRITFDVAELQLFGVRRETRNRSRCRSNRICRTTTPGKDIVLPSRTPFVSVILSPIEFVKRCSTSIILSSLPLSQSGILLVLHTYCCNSM